MSLEARLIVLCGPRSGFQHNNPTTTIFIIIGATSNDIIAQPMCQVSDLISSAKVEVGSLALVDFCSIFGSSWFQSFNVFGIKLSLKVSVRACGI